MIGAGTQYVYVPRTYRTTYIIFYTQYLNLDSRFINPNKAKAIQIHRFWLVLWHSLKNDRGIFSKSIIFVYLCSSLCLWLYVNVSVGVCARECMYVCLNIGERGETTEWNQSRRRKKIAKTLAENQGRNKMYVRHHCHIYKALYEWGAGTHHGGHSSVYCTHDKNIYTNTKR